MHLNIIRLMTPPCLLQDFTLSYAKASRIYAQQIYSLSDKITRAEFVTFNMIYLMLLHNISHILNSN